MSDPWDDDDDEIIEEIELDEFAVPVVKARPEKDRIDLRQSRRQRGPKPQDIAVLHANDDFFVVDKPAGFFIDQDIAEEKTVFQQLQEKYEEDSGGWRTIYPMPPEASGLVLIARSTSAHAAFIKQINDGQMTLTELVIVRGRVESESGTFSQSLLVPGIGAKTIVSEERGGKAVTEWRVVDRFVGYTLLECRPRTTVPNQLRAHLQAAGTPLAVDPIYGGSDRLMLSSFKAGYRRSNRRDELPLIRRLSFHAEQLEMKTPDTASPLEFRSPLPKDFRATLHQLGRFGRIPK